MTNDTTTLNGALNELGETLAENLTEKGVTADASEGLTTLANKIKDITFDLSATLTLTSGVNEVLLNQPAYFSVSLININDQPIANGVIIFKDTGTDTVLGSCVTDETGMATFNHIIDDFGSFNIQAEFLGLDGCTSNTVTINCNYDLNITSDKDILSSYDNDSCTITANLLNSNNEPIESEDIDYRVVHGETEIDSGTLTTNIDGDISVDYDATGIGDVEVIFSLRSLLQKTYVIEDCQYWNTSEVQRDTTNGSTIYDTNMSQSLPSDCEISFDIWSNNENTGGEHRFFMIPKSQYNNDTTQPQYALFVDQVGGNKGRLGQRNNNATIDFISKYSLTKSIYHTVKIIKTDTILEFYIDNELKTTQTLDWINNYTDYCFSMMRWTSIGTSKMKNVKIKAL